MKLKCFYFSPTATTKKVVLEIAKGIGGEIIPIDLTIISQNKQEYLVSKDEIAIIGVPVYGGRVPEIIIPTLENIKGNGGHAIIICNYGNANYGDSLVELYDLIGDFDIIGAGLFIGEHSYTKKVAKFRPDMQDLKIAYDFGVELKNIIENNNARNVGSIIPGNRPYKNRKPKQIWTPLSNDDCIYCRQCPRVCPVEIIDKKDPDIVDISKCIHCCACIKICTFNGREIRDEKTKELIKVLEKDFITRLEPQIFIKKL